VIDQKVVNLVIERAAGYCEYCDCPAEESMALHHRKLKSRGGQDTVVNLVWVHHGCHNMKTDSIHFQPKVAEKLGYMVHSWADPAEVSLIRADGSVVLLKEDGMVTLITEAHNESDNYSR
jgi:hypothetical protein